MHSDLSHVLPLDVTRVNRLLSTLLDALQRYQVEEAKGKLKGRGSDRSKIFSNAAGGRR